MPSASSTLRSRPQRDDEALAAAVDRFARAWRRAQLRAQPSEGLTAAQFHLLEPLLTADAPMSVGALAQAAGVASPTATRMLDALVRSGVCARERDPDDRRCVRISLTRAGRAAAEQRRERMLDRRRRVLGSLSAAERRDAVRLLPRLAAAIEELPE
jgi:DNA-binding MarR family transcriptional regulator